MTIDEAIELVKIEKECVTRADNLYCNRNCIECDLVQDTNKLLYMYEQLAEWLEELKEYRKTNLNPSMIKDLVRSEKKAHRIALENAEKIDSYVDEFEKNIRNKAIDDFVKKLKEHDCTCNFDWEYYDEIAEQLKVGEEKR